MSSCHNSFLFLDLYLISPSAKCQWMNHCHVQNKPFFPVVHLTLTALDKRLEASVNVCLMLSIFCKIFDSNLINDDAILFANKTKYWQCYHVISTSQGWDALNNFFETSFIQGISIINTAFTIGVPLSQEHLQILSHKMWTELDNKTVLYPPLLWHHGAPWLYTLTGRGQNRGCQVSAGGRGPDVSTRPGTMMNM